MTSVGTALGVPQLMGTQPLVSPATPQPLASSSHGDRALGIPRLTRSNPWWNPCFWHHSSQLSTSRVTHGDTTAFGIPFFPWGPNSHCPPWRQCCIPSMGTMASLVLWGTSLSVSHHPQHPLSQGAPSLVPPHHLCALDELLSGSGGVVPLPAPGAQRRCLQCPPIGEGESPWPHQRARVDGVEVNGSLLLALTPGQEGDTCRQQGYGSL